MVVLLNLILPTILIVGCFAAYKLRKVWPVIAAVVLCLLYNMFQPSYMPKGEVVRRELPPLETSQMEIQDKLLKPRSAEEYDAKREQQIKEGLPFKQGEEE